MRATITKCSLILVLLAIPVTGALAQPPTPEATPSPAPTATPLPQPTEGIRLGSFDLGPWADLAAVATFIMLALVSAYATRVLRPMQRAQVELLERQVETLEREKKALENILTKEKAYLETQLRDAQAKANISLDLTLPSQPIPLDPKDRETLQQILNRLERIESVSIATGAEKPRPDPWKHLSQGNLHFNLQHYEQAIEKYNEALDLKPDFPPAFYNRGSAYSQLGQYERAIEDYDRALELEPDDHIALNSRGIAYGRLGQYERAIQDYDKALELEPDSPQALNNRGLDRAYLGQYERAIQDLNRALEVKPDYSSARYNMACVYSLMNKPDEALKWLREAIELDEKFRDMAKTDPDFDNIRDDPRFRALVYSEEEPS